jgi:hypothetical protein
MITTEIQSMIDNHIIPPIHTGVELINIILQEHFLHVATNRPNVIYRKPGITDVDYDYAKQLSVIRRKRNKNINSKNARAIKATPIPTREYPSMITNEIQDIIARRVYPPASSGIEVIDIIMREKFGHYSERQRGKGFIQQPGITDEEYIYGQSLLALRRNRKSGEINKRKRENNQQYNEARNTHYKHYRRKRRLIANESLYETAYLNVISMFHSLSRRGLTCTLTRDEVLVEAVKPCYYCGDEWSGGIDRADNNGNYTPDNIVASCWRCNKMKCAHNQSNFYRYCHEIVNCSSTDVTKCAKQKKIYLKWKKTCGHDVDISDVQFSTLLCNLCTYCGVPNANGIDRINSSGHYTNDNVVSCCMICNKMKNNLPLDLFLDHVKKINNVFNQRVVQNELTS